MSRDEIFGHQDARRGDRCTNPGQEDVFTTPCCFFDLQEAATRCPECGAPIRCSVESQPVAVCTIADEDEQDD